MSGSRTRADAPEMPVEKVRFRDGGASDEPCINGLLELEVDPEVLHFLGNRTFSDDGLAVLVGKSCVS